MQANSATCLLHHGKQQSEAMLCGWEGNRRPGIALIMHHRLYGIHSPPTGLIGCESKMKSNNLPTLLYGYPF